jgi:hypothetical protein
MLMSTSQERQMVVEMSEQVLVQAIKQLDPQYYHAFSNMLHDFILVTNPRKKLGNPRDLRNLIRFIADIVNQAMPIKTYTTGELAKIFGVSVQAVNKWIDEGRFLGYKREGNNRHNHIPETTSFAMRSGEFVPVCEIAAMYEQQRKEHKVSELTPDQHKDAILDEIARLMKKYGGTYELTLGKRDDLTIGEDRDATIWRSLLDELREMNEA